MNNFIDLFIHIFFCVFSSTSWKSTVSYFDSLQSTKEVFRLFLISDFRIIESLFNDTDTEKVMNTRQNYQIQAAGLGSDGSSRWYKWMCELLLSLMTVRGGVYFCFFRAVQHARQWHPIQSLLLFLHTADNGGDLVSTFFQGLHWILFKQRFIALFL